MRAPRRLPVLPPPPDPRAELDDEDLSEGSTDAASNDEAVAIGRISPLPKLPASPPHESGWFAKRAAPAPAAPPSEAPSSRRSAPPRASWPPAIEENELIGVQTSRARRYSFIAPRSGRKLGTR